MQFEKVVQVKTWCTFPEKCCKNFLCYQTCIKLKYILKFNLVNLYLWEKLGANFLSNEFAVQKQSLQDVFVKKVFSKGGLLLKRLFFSLRLKMSLLHVLLSSFTNIRFLFWIEPNNLIWLNKMLRVSATTIMVQIIFFIRNKN